MVLCLELVLMLLYNMMAHRINALMAVTLFCCLAADACTRMCQYLRYYIRGCWYYTQQTVTQHVSEVVRYSIVPKDIRGKT
jgi:hypothetical protein